MTNDYKFPLLVVGVLFVISVLIIWPSFFPTFFRSNSFLSEHWFSRPLQLGLDLVGGSYVLYEIDEEKFKEQLANRKFISLKNSLASQEIPVLSLERKGVTGEFVFVSDRSLNKAKDILSNDPDLVIEGINYETKSLIVTYKPSNLEKIAIESTDRAVEIIRNRVDQFGVAEPVIQRLGARRVLVELPGVKDLDRVKSVIGKTAQLEFRFLPRSKNVPVEKLPLFKTMDHIEVEREVVLTGDKIQKANVELTQTEGSVVAIQFNVEGAKEFAKITRENIGKNLAIILDSVVYSAPQIQTAITDGNAIITGLRNPQEARELAVVLRSGTLPAPLRVIEERVVGPTLGEIYLERAVWTLVVTLVSILALMILWYKWFGFIASISLLLNLVFIFACLVIFQATLTFPGMAALALTIGVAVDSNIIIFERIRDHLGTVPLKEAVSRGFENAYSAVLDANMTSLITSLLVYLFAHGPIKGFALIFSIGVITTLFCAVFVTKHLANWMLENNFPVRIS